MMDLSIVIVAYKDDEVLRACLMSLAGARGVTSEVIVVDNGNQTSTQDVVHDVAPDATYIANPSNRGFAAAVNQGLKLRRGRYALLLNPDTVVPPDAMKRMVEHLDTDKEVGIASSIIVYPDGSLQESIRRFPKLCDQLLVMLKVPHVFPNIWPIKRYMMRDADPYKTQDVDSIMGAFMFIRSEVLEKIGLLDERYFIWFEEVDYCKMAVDAGFKVRHYADVTITHHKGHSFNKVSTLRKQKWMRQSLRKYLKKHHGVLPWSIMWLLNPVFVFSAYVAATLKRG